MWVFCTKGKGQWSLGLHDLAKFTVQSLTGNTDFLFGFKSVHMGCLVKLQWLHWLIFFWLWDGWSLFHLGSWGSCRQDLAEFRASKMVFLKWQVLSREPQSCCLWPARRTNCTYEWCHVSAPLENGYKSWWKGLGSQACAMSLWLYSISQKESQKHLNFKK